MLRLFDGARYGEAPCLYLFVFTMMPAFPLFMPGAQRAAVFARLAAAYILRVHVQCAASYFADMARRAICARAAPLYTARRGASARDAPLQRKSARAI